MPDKLFILLSSTTTKLLLPGQNCKASNRSNLPARGMCFSSASSGLKFAYSHHVAQLAEVTEQDQKEKKLHEKKMKYEIVLVTDRLQFMIKGINLAPTI